MRLLKAVNLLMKSLYHVFIRQVETVLQYVQPNHQANPLGLTASVAVIGKQPIRDIILINTIHQDDKLMIFLQKLLVPSHLAAGDYHQSMVRPRLMQRDGPWLELKKGIGVENWLGNLYFKITILLLASS